MIDHFWINTSGVARWIASLEEHRFIMRRHI